MWTRITPNSDTFHAVKLIDLLNESKGLIFATILVFEFTKIQSDDKSLYSTLHSNSKAETVVNEIDIDDVFESIYSIII